MLRQISEDVRVNLKDRLREMRDAIRQNRHDSAGDAGALREVANHLPPFPGKGIEDLLSHAASAVDDALTIAESLIPHTRPLRVDGTTVKSLDVYFAADDRGEPPAGERLFRRDMYYLAKAVLDALGIEGARVHEASFAAAHASMRSRHGDLLTAMTQGVADQRLSAVAAACSALLVEMVGQRPVRLAGAEPDVSAPAAGHADLRCLAPLVLACGLATLDTSGAREPDMLDIAVLVADVRHERIAGAFGRPDTVDELTAVFAPLLAHLP